MPLYMATHTVEVVTAKVPLTMIMLMDNIKRSSIPTELRPRVVLPTGSTISISLWDAPSAETLEAWLNECLQFDAVHAVSEVQEEFSWGLTSVLATQRAADKVAAGSRGALSSLSATASKASGGIQRQLEALDQRTNIISRITTMRGAGAAGAGAVPSTGAGAGGEGAGPEGAATGPSTSEVLAANMSAGLSKARSTFSWLGQSIQDQLLPKTAGVPHQQPSGPSEPVMPTFPPPAYRYDSGSNTSTQSQPTTRPTAAPTTAAHHSAGDDEDTLESLDTLDRLHQLPVSSHAATTPLTPAAVGLPPLPPSGGTALPPVDMVPSTTYGAQANSFTLGDEEDSPVKPPR